MKLIYMAGPFRGADSWDVENNIRNVEGYAMNVALAGAVPVIPHSMYRYWNGTLTDNFWLSATMDVLRRCDAIFMCPNWSDSAGSKAEKAEAERLGLPVFEWDNEPFDSLARFLHEEFSEVNDDDKERA